MEIFLYFCRSYSTVPYFDTWEFFLVHRFVCIRSMALPNSVYLIREWGKHDLCVFSWLTGKNLSLPVPVERERIVECRLWHPFPCVLMVGLLWTISSKADIYAQLALLREGEGKKTEVSGCVGKEIWLALTYILSLRKDQKVFRRVMARTGFSNRKNYFCVWLCYVQLSHGILWTHCGRWCFNILQFLQHLKLFFHLH